MGARPGVHVVAVTPFLPDESLDLASLVTLLEFCHDAGAQGILILGVMGEADRLADVERVRVIDTVVTANERRLQVTVGVTAGSSVVARQRAEEARRRGADMVMISPPPGSRPGPALRKHFQRVGDDLGIPLVIQDHPASSAVQMPVEFIADLLSVLPGASVKLEDPPTPPKMARLRALAPDVPIFGGLGGVSLLGELAAGANGVMTGFGFPETLVAIVHAYQTGDQTAARRTFRDALPMMLFESQPGIATGVRKEILRRRGAIAHATVRQPAPTLDASTLIELEVMMESRREAGMTV